MPLNIWFACKEFEFEANNIDELGDGMAQQIRHFSIAFTVCEIEDKIIL